MLTYAIKRIGLGLLILVLVMVAMYAAVFLVPGDPASVALGPRATPELKRLLIERMGLDQPVWWQIVEFFRNALTGNLGYDVWSNRPVSTLVMEALPNTLILGLTALAVALLIGVPLGCLSVMRRGTLADAVIGVLSVGVIAVPSFVVAIYSLLLFAVTLRWLPAIGAGEAGDIVSQAKALVMPAAAIALGWIGYIARMVRASMMEVMENRTSAPRAPSACRSGRSSPNTRCASPSSPPFHWSPSASAASCPAPSSSRRCLPGQASAS